MMVSNKTPQVQQGDIWLVDFNPTKGHEMQKIRPAVVINGNFSVGLDLKIVVPITSWNKEYVLIWWLYKLSPDKTNGLNTISAVNCYQMRCVTETRFTKYLGSTGNNLEEIVATAQNCLELY